MAISSVQESKSNLIKKRVGWNSEQEAALTRAVAIYNQHFPQNPAYSALGGSYNPRAFVIINKAPEIRRMNRRPVELQRKWIQMVSPSEKPLRISNMEGSTKVRDALQAIKNEAPKVFRKGWTEKDEHVLKEAVVRYNLEYKEDPAYSSPITPHYAYAFSVIAQDPEVAKLNKTPKQMTSKWIEKLCPNVLPLPIPDDHLERIQKIYNAMPKKWEKIAGAFASEDTADKPKERYYSANAIKNRLNPKKVKKSQEELSVLNDSNLSLSASSSTSWNLDGVVEECPVLAQDIEDVFVGAIKLPDRL